MATDSPEGLLKQGADQGRNYLKKGWKGYKKRMDDRAAPWLQQGAYQASQHAADWRSPEAHQAALDLGTGKIDIEQFPGYRDKKLRDAEDAAKALNAQGHSMAPKAMADIMGHVNQQRVGDQNALMGQLTALSGLGYQASSGQGLLDTQFSRDMMGLNERFGENRYQHGANQAGIGMDYAKNAAGLMAAQQQQDAANANALRSGVIGAIGTIGGAALGGPMGAQIGGAIGSKVGGSVG